MKKALLAAAAAGMVSWTLSGAAMAAERAQIITAPVGSIVHTVGSAIASVVSQNTDLDLLAVPMSGPQVLVPQLNSGRGEFTLINAADAYEALRGEPPAYRAPNANLRLVAVGFTNELGLITPRNSPIRTAEDIRGKRVTGVFSAHQTCQKLATAQLANLGLTWDDVRVVPVTHSRQAVQAIGEGRADVAMCVPLGQAIVREVNAQTPIRFISMNDAEDAVQKVRQHFPTGRLVSYPAGSADGVLEDVNIWSYPFYLVAHKDVSPDAVHTVLTTLAENMDDLRAVSGVFNRWDPQAMADPDMTIPVHEGAVRFFTERGQWDDALQSAQEKLLDETQTVAGKG
ncbi:TAXI family TRAP transporter solute-binding subunit [Telmatospirillum sp. J64-1]|uniref:TAXI family TRAP transporter solute-binding subunit n=1 Tax=Telmatospirillum sp. J64-1 TaxID=2502183 RepID=UPI00115C8083|nr:TAXI family TRAP transporter solute-binding subunit [Telmatospirillum sp. J64-1]